jgi:hypothetical protein
LEDDPRVWRKLHRPARIERRRKKVEYLVVVSGFSSNVMWSNVFLVTHDQQFGNYRSAIIQLDVNLAKL